MRGGDEAHVDGLVRVGAEPADFAVLQHAQELRLELRGQLANLVEEDGAAVSLLEGADARWRAPVKEPFSWPNSSLSRRLAGMAPQSTVRNGAEARALAR